jgi:hypothetical protein
MPGSRKVRVRNFAGSTKEEIGNEPEWHASHNHSVGYRNNQERIASFTHDDDHEEKEDNDQLHLRGDLDGLKGHLHADIIKEHCFNPGDDATMVCLCCPAAIIQKPRCLL